MEPLIKKRLFCLAYALFLTGCAIKNDIYKPDTLAKQEEILSKTHNYEGLITLYREQLKIKESADLRLKLAKTYYLKQDYHSTQRYLAPLLKEGNQKASILYNRNLIALGDYPKAIQTSITLIKKYPRNPELYNLMGIALALSGHIEKAQRLFNQSRDMFLDDDIILNNMAVALLMQEKYDEAIDLLMPLYLKNTRQPRSIYNLVFALIKQGDLQQARDIIIQESLSTTPDKLINALNKVAFKGMIG